MFIAVAIDENNQTLLIGFGLVVENNIYCCTWFLMRLIEALRQGREVSFITNADDVISSCIEHVFPDSYNGYIYKSLFKTLQPLFWMTSNSYSVSDFEENFHQLTRDAHEVIANMVCSVPSNKDPARHPISALFDSKKNCVVDLTVIHVHVGNAQSGIVCDHAIATSCHSNIHELADMVQIYYRADVFQTAYQTKIMHPLPPPSEWEIPNPLIEVLLPM
uniref:MULE transposase domain-containing protein n=1 Tax=Lactuca sativa TaxID=4236 RepID=A0A9R1VK32_LACSA|nr:hypothetical protein LSAT_V11C400170670 [Lactuca sativa]